MSPLPHGPDVKQGVNIGAQSSSPTVWPSNRQDAPLGIFLVRSHMLRHACGFQARHDGHDTRPIQGYLGHRSIMSTIRYTVLDGEPVQELLERLGGAAQSEAKTASPP